MGKSSPAGHSIWNLDQSRSFYCEGACSNHSDGNCWVWFCLRGQWMHRFYFCCMLKKALQTDIIAVQRVYYDQVYSFAYQWLLVMSTQLVSFVAPLNVRKDTNLVLHRLDFQLAVSHADTSCLPPR